MNVRHRAAELVPGARPDQHYAMTEVVHCKSRGELGVADAVPRCARTHLDAIVALSPAPLIVVLGARARDHVAGLWDLPTGFGTKVAIGNERRNLAIRKVGGTERVIAYLWHPTGMTAPKTFANAYPGLMPLVTDLVNDRATVEDARQSIDA